jgi:hypothetical protein
LQDVLRTAERRVKIMSSLNDLKAVSVKDLESAIAEAVSTLTGDRYECTISELSYGFPVLAKFDTSISIHVDFLTDDEREYYVYENWQAEEHKAVIHFADCSFCKNGQGIHPEAGSENGQWHGPFKTYQEASAGAQNTGGRPRDCQHCRPS